MRVHKVSEINSYGSILSADANTVLATGLGMGVSDLTGRRLEQAQIENAETSHMVLMRYADVTGVLTASSYLVTEGVTYVVDYTKDPREPRPYMWVEIYCHAERINS